MNQPTLAALDALLKAVGSESTQLGSGTVATIGLISAPFTPSPTLTLASLTEATFNGYARKPLGNASVTFSGGDGKEYIEFPTVQFTPTGSTSPNTCYGVFFTFGNSSTTLWGTDAFATPVPMASPANQITITPRIGADPAGNWGLNIISF